MKNKFLKGLVVSLALTVSGFANAGLIGATGPNLFGYEGTDITYNLRQIDSTGTEVLAGMDDSSFYASLGFDFSFYGSIYDSVYVGSNGVLSFTNNSSFCCTASPSPTSGIDIAFAWTDSDLSEGGNAYFQTLGTSGSREFVFGYYNIAHNSDYGGDDVLSNTMEVILHEGSNNIEFQYGELFQHELRYGSEKISIGIQNTDGTDGLNVAYFGDVDAKTLRYSNQGYLISTDLPSVDVPEPSTLAIFALGLMGLSSRKLKKQA